ncbi:MAG: ATP-binding protein [Leptolyngbyaceae cyanobacterium bins.349]|nr:ATP-binding protein [Leptolyngbyaceae cyanobacterium bins.349]
MQPVIKILIVEDEKLVADDLRETLELLGYQVPCLVGSAEAAIAKLPDLAIDLVLMDIRLTGPMDGIEASQIIQSQYRVPVVYLTANTDRATLDRVKASQPFGYILKPFNERTLATTIEVALARHEAEASVYNALCEAQSSQQQVETQLQQKNSYLSLVAHELRNPLTAIKFASEVLNNQAMEMPEERRQRYLQRIHDATKNLNDLLEDVLLLERSSTSDLACLLAPVDLVGFCQELLDAFQLTDTAAHHFALTTEGQSRPLHLDEKLLWHLLSNLVSNAMKYSHPGSPITIALDWQIDQVIIRVIDQGIGIPPETQARLFEPFQRGRNVGTIPGTGLGLAIAKRCAELQQGQLSMTSAVGNGSTFQITFPYPSP